MLIRVFLVATLVGFSNLVAAANSSRRLLPLRFSPEFTPQFAVAPLRHQLDADFEGFDGCEKSHAAEALATPDPFLERMSAGRIAVSFVIGADGRVHSPIILESAGGQDEDRSVLDTLLSWRFRPATCNATAMETENKVEFSAVEYRAR